MKEILISKSPKQVANILNGKQSVIVSKTAPKCDFPIEVYIYCTKGDPYLIDRRVVSNGEYEAITSGEMRDRNRCANITPESKCVLNGRVVARFTLNKIENFINGMNELEREWDGKPDDEYDYFAYEKALEKACLTYEEADEYCPDKSFYAWHISDLVIFDKPRELHNRRQPPRSWCYLEERK